jgi:DNA-directed RNA polymerase subunit RPC12/RpoP
MIRFSCQHCGAQLQVSPARAGKEGRCPHCKNRLTVPPPPEPELELVRDESPADTRTPSKLFEDVAVGPRPLPAGKADEARPSRLLQGLADSLQREEAPRPPGVRRLPWFLDILLYPASLSGVIALVLMVLFPLFLRLLPIPMVFLWGGLRFLGPVAALGLYLGWYLAECVYDSAKGGTRAPAVFDMGDWSDWWSRVSYLAAVYILFGLPPVLYWMLMGRTDVIFWALMVWAIVFLPMGLLAMVIHDSVSALNPLFLLGSIWRVLGPYLGLLLGIGVVVGLFWRAGGGGVDRRLAPPIVLPLFHVLLGAYMSLVLAHLLGRFYWCYRDRLDWGI